ncbi:uncharacterized protein LOC114519402 [Dendronephthya gigantea]|uniref:uncharacterized protein LOC114519402 n=1 Tax=Dendronephthya gigantea TaxID=151771 RepID=UPI00106ACE29|nr:uncharacterized protein LOC114519402 [Dendronephthya gigantea]
MEHKASGSTSVREYGSKHFRDDEITSQSPMQSTSLAIVKFLVEYCAADLSCKDELARTALHHAVDVGEKDIVKYFVEQCGADVNDKDKRGRTALNYAVTEGSLEIVKYIVEHGADVNDKDKRGWTALNDAVTIGALEMVKYLVEHGADVNDKDTYGWTVLHYALIKGTVEIVKYLVEHGADVNGKDTYGWTVLRYAVTKGTSERSVHTLGNDILKMAVVKNSVALVNLLLEKIIAVWRAGTLLVEGRQMSLLEWSIYLGYDEITTILKRKSILF